MLYSLEGLNMAKTSCEFGAGVCFSVSLVAMEVYATVTDSMALTTVSKQAHQSITEVSKQELLITKAHSQHAVEELGDSLVLLQDGIDWPVRGVRPRLIHTIQITWLNATHHCWSQCTAMDDAGNSKSQLQIDAYHAGIASEVHKNLSALELN